MRIAAIEPYAALSHRLFLEGLQHHSRHEIEILSLPARAWKWRMRTAALHFAPELAARGPWDLFFVSDYLNLAELRALLAPPLRDVPAVLYFHENQLTYPLQPGEARDNHFALVHLYSCLASRAVLFNSAFHRESFLDALAALLSHVPDVDVAASLREVRERSAVLPLGTDAEARAPRWTNGTTPTVLWNHRWEYDKAPDTFVDALRELDARGADFRVRVLGQRFRTTPDAFARLRDSLGARLDAVGFVSDRTDYLEALAGAHVVVSTARHEFFGLSTLEALRSGLHPVLPNRLAYPELLPPPARAGGRYLYDGPDEVEALVASLEGALATVRSEGPTPEREALVAYTERFTWPRVAPRFDEAFERAAAPEIGPVS